MRLTWCCRASAGSRSPAEYALEVANPPPLIAITGYGQKRDREAR
ncbi:hypothetical protein [Polaromonas sp. CG9_12]|nr:hypothetical protein [Polaromonas sp. CG9_12]